MKKGNTEMDGVIITTKGTLDYYKGQGEATREELRKPNGHRIQTIKTGAPVAVANNKVTVLVYPCGKVEILASENGEDV